MTFLFYTKIGIYKQRKITQYLHEFIVNILVTLKAIDHIVHLTNIGESNAVKSISLQHNYLIQYKV